MAEHYCKEHQTAWFKKGKMKNYAHPVKDEQGEDTGEWCNEPEGGAKPEGSKPPKPDDMSKGDWAEKDMIHRSSIEAQTAFKGVIELIVAKVVSKDDPLGQTALNYAMSKLGNWSSQGGETPKPRDEGKTLSKQSLKALADVALGQKYAPTNVTAIIMNEFGKGKASELTDKEGLELQEILIEGKYKDPEDIEF